MQRTILQYGIDPDDIYNFDEIGFAIGMTATAKVVTRTDYYNQQSLLQPGNCEWATSIECTNASGWTLPPCIIFKGQVFIEFGSKASRAIGASNLAQMDGLLVKLDFGGSKSTLFHQQLLVRKRNTDF